MFKFFKKKVLMQLDKGGFMPKRAHNYDAGFDLFSSEDYYIKARQTRKVDTKVHVSIPKGYVGFVLPRSSVSAQGIHVATGVIDTGYMGKISIVVTAPYDIRVIKGERIAQLVIVKAPVFELQQSDRFFSKTERGFNGFGSTGK